MGGFLSLNESTVSKTIRMGDSTATFHVKEVLSKRDMNTAFQAVMEAAAEMPRRDLEQAAAIVADPSEAPRVTVDLIVSLPAGQLSILKLSIVDWDLTYPDNHPEAGNKVPVSDETIEQLSAPVVDELCDFIKQQNHIWTASEEENLD